MTTKFEPDNELILEASLFKVPLELIRRNFKSAQRHIEKDTKAIAAAINEAAKKAQSGETSAEETVASLDAMIKRMQNLKRKVRPTALSVPVTRTHVSVAGGSPVRRAAVAQTLEASHKACCTVVRYRKYVRSGL
jgi:phage-related minor tail protein